VNNGGTAAARDRIVWTDWRNDVGTQRLNPDIYLYDLVAQTEWQLTSDTLRQFYPDMTAGSETIRPPFRRFIARARRPCAGRWRFGNPSRPAEVRRWLAA